MQTKTVMMPRELTEENGAKYLLSGSFYSEIVQECTDCDGEGWEDKESGEECYTCKGAGTVTERCQLAG